MIKFKKEKIVLAPIYVIPIYLRKFIEDKIEDGCVKIKLVELDEKIGGTPPYEVKCHNWVAQLVDAPYTGEFKIFYIELDNLREINSKKTE